MSADDSKNFFNHVIDEQSRSLVFVMIPFFSLVLWVLECRKRRFYGEHLVFSFYSYAFWLAIGQIVIALMGKLVLFGVALIRVQLSDHRVDSCMAPLMLLVYGVHLFIALRRFYGDRIFWAAAKA
jgi:hypothetical protein